MIQKVMPKMISSKPIVRQNLQKTAAVGLALLAGSSMSNWSGPRFVDTNMIIPNGLTFKEKAYYLMTGKMPKSVHERWFEKTDDYMPHDGDQELTVGIADGQYIGNVSVGPHDVTTGEALLGETPDGTLASDISSGGLEVVGGDTETTDDGLPLSEIWKHLSGVEH